MIRAEEIGKRAGRRTLLSGINLQVGAGELVALLGPNGAGKSTLLKILALLVRPTSGRLWLANRDASRGADLRRLIGVVLHDSLLYDTLTAEENLQFYGRLFGLSAGEAARRGAALLERVGLALYGRELVSQFSQGMRQRLAVARALLHQPAVLLWDEPFTGLDPAGSSLLNDLLCEHRQSGGAGLFVTHQWEYALNLADRVAIMAGGRIAVDRPVGSLNMAALGQLFGRATEARQG